MRANLLTDLRGVRLFEPLSVAVLGRGITIVPLSADGSSDSSSRWKSLHVDQSYALNRNEW